MDICNSSVSPLSQKNFKIVKAVIIKLQDLMPYWVNTFTVVNNPGMDFIAQVESKKEYGQMVLEIQHTFFSLDDDRQLMTIAHELAHSFTLPMLTLIMKILVEDFEMEDGPMRDMAQRIMTDLMESTTEELSVVFVKLLGLEGE